jgi:nucleoside-diphosphate-sugar epimerase
MRILLTGASGFTGRHFIQQAESAGHTVVSLEADLTDLQSVLAGVKRQQFDAVVHLAAISFVGHADDAAFYAVNVVGTTHLLSALSELLAKPGCVLIASSANVYGNCERSPIAESQPPAPVNHYAMSKWAMETMAKTYTDRLPMLITRPFNYTGLGQSPDFLIPKLVKHFKARSPVIELGNLHVEREFNDVRMVCDAYLRLLTVGQTAETYNICSGRPFTLQSVIELLIELTGHEPDIQVNPKFVRQNEVVRLCGDPGKLWDVTGDPPNYPLRETLAWMLDG